MELRNIATGNTIYNTEKDVNYNYGKAYENTTSSYYTKCRFQENSFQIYPLV